MAGANRTKRHRRGFFGWLIKLIFTAFNILMAVSLLSYWIDLAEHIQPLDVENRGWIMFGGMLASGPTILFWFGGAAVLGLLTLLTRGRRVSFHEPGSPIDDRALEQDIRREPRL